MKQQYCLECDKMITPIIITITEPHAIRDDVFSIDALSAICPTCQTEYLLPETHDVNLHKLQTLYKQKHNLLQSEEIKAIREKYALTQSAFASLLGLGEKTVTRYENGYIQDEAPNTLMAMMDDLDTFAKLVEMKQDKLKPPEYQRILQRIGVLLAKEEQHGKACIKAEGGYNRYALNSSMPRGTFSPVINRKAMSLNV